MTCGVPAVSSSHPVAALTTTQQSNPTMPRLFDRGCTIPSNRDGDAGENPKSEEAVIVHGEESATLEPE